MEQKFCLYAIPWSSIRGLSNLYSDDVLLSDAFDLV